MPSDADAPTANALHSGEPAKTLPMTPDRLRWVLDVIGWSQRELARQAPTAEESARAMARGKKPIPDDLARWLEVLVAIVQAGPQNWRNSAQGRSRSQAA